MEDIAHRYRRALRAAAGRHVDYISRPNRDAHALCRALFTSYKLNMTHSGDGGQRLAAKAHRSDGLEPLFVVQLARRVPREGQPRVLGAHAAAVVGYFYICRAAAFKLDRQLFGSRVKGVFHELLYDRRGPLDDLAGGDHISHKRRKDVNACHV